MSLDLQPPAAYFQKKNEIAQVVQSRKRKLIELYHVATSAEALPKVRLPLDGHHLPDLALFLQQNDIEQGHYFQDATLPLQHNFAYKLAKTQQASSLAAPSSSQRTSSGPLSLDSLPQAALPTKTAVVEDTNRINDDETANVALVSQNRDPAPQDNVRAVTVDADKPALVKRLSNIVVDDDQAHSRQRSPRLTLQAESFSHRNTIINPSRPVSPPYSPGTEPTRTGLLPPTNDTANNASDAPSNILTPRRDNQDAVGTNRKSSDHEMFDSVEDLSEVSHAESFRLKEHLDHGSSVRANIVPASPSDTSHSAHTARTTAQSPVTSPDGNASPTSPDTSKQPSRVELLTPLEANHVSDKSDTVQTGWKHGPEPQGVSSTSAHKSATLDVTPASSDTLQDPQVSIIEENVSQSSNAKANDLPHDGSSFNGLVSAKIAGVNVACNVLEGGVPDAVKQVLDLLPEDKDAVSTNPMDVDQPDIPVAQITATIASYPPQAIGQKSVRVQKRRSKRGTRHTQFILGRPSEDRYIETLRGLRKEHALKHVTSQSYLKPLVQYQVYNAENLKPVDHLLMGTSKTITTFDFMASIREEQDLRVLDRTRNLQSNLRWSLRQPKPSVEPSQLRSHWDVVISSMKWLRTDFREEAKLKAAIAKNLATWCAAWVAADRTDRTAMQVKVKSKPHLLMQSEANEDSGSHEQFPPSPNREEHSHTWLANDKGFDNITNALGGVSCDPNSLQLGDELLSKFPLYEPRKHERPVAETSSREPVQPTGSEEVVIRLPDRRSTGEQTKRDDPQDTDEEREPPLAPENTSCALFNPESRPLRARLTAPWIFKPPTAPMPPQVFYEYRSASQWNWEDDMLLKQYTKDFPSNWPLIADRIAPKTSFTSFTDRRTPWECYERLLAMEGPPNDAQARQYLRHFSYRLEKARESFDKHQNAIREINEQHAQNAGQPLPVLPQRRFPTPMRVERKPNKRFLALLDCARKLARKREQSAAKQQNQSQQEGQAQKPAPGTRMQQNQTPQYFSRIKYEAEVKDQEQRQSLRDQQRAMIEAQRRQQGGQQAHLTNGIGQQMRNRISNGQVNTTAQVPTVANNPLQARQLPQQPSMPMGLPNGTSSNAQLAQNTRPQANMQSQQRLAPHINGQPAPTPDAIRMAQQQIQAQRAYHISQQQQQQQQNLQHQFGRISPNVAGTNSVSNANMLAAFNNANSSYPLTLHDAVSTPNLPQQVPNGVAPRVSPHISQASNFQQSPSQPQQLSSGHVTAIVNLEHQIRSQNPNMSPQEVRHHATMQLKHLTSMSRQNAINAATGAHPQAHPIMRGASGTQSPYPLAPQQQATSTPQISQLPQQQAQQQHSPYQQNGLLSTPSSHSAHGHSPVNIPANIAGSPQLQAQQPQSQYSAQLRQAMYAQQQRQHPINIGQASVGVGNSSGSPSAQHVSPAMSMAIPSFAGMNRTPSSQSMGGGLLGSGVQGQAQSMRPPSRSASSMGGIDGQFPQVQTQQQRPMPSPRPLSSQGFSGQ